MFFCVCGKTNKSAYLVEMLSLIFLFISNDFGKHYVKITKIGGEIDLH